MSGPPSSLPEAAAWFAQRRWAVFQLNGKVPRISKAQGGKGFGDATAELAIVRRMWRSRPKCNIGWGLRIDAVPYVVVDDDGGAAEELAATDRALPATLTVTTRSKNRRHYIYRADGLTLTGQPDVPLTRSKANTRVAGFGYTVLPPSIHPETGAVYAFDSDPRFIADAPAWLAELITHSVPSPASKILRDDHLLNDEDRVVLECVLDLEPSMVLLWEGRWEELGRYSSQSEADFAFLSYLRNLGADPDRMQRLFRASGLYREKTDAARPGGTYLTRSIARLIAMESRSHVR